MVIGGAHYRYGLGLDDSTGRHELPPRPIKESTRQILRLHMDGVRIVDITRKGYTRDSVNAIIKKYRNGGYDLNKEML